MTRYNSLNLKLSNSVIELNSAKKQKKMNKTDVFLTLSSNMIGDYG